MRTPSAFSRFTSMCILLIVCWTLRVSAATFHEPPFIVHYPPGEESLALYTAEVLTDAAILYDKRLPLGATEVNVHLFTTADSFQEFAGDLPTRRVQGFALSEQGLIALKAPQLLPPDTNFPGVVRHELLHVLIARNTNREHVPRWFNEGIAMLLSRENRLGNLWSTTQLSFRGGILPLDQLEDAFATPGNEWDFGAAYEQSLSITRFLRDRIGEEAFWTLVWDLRTTSLENALGRRDISLADLESAWRKDLRRKAIFGAILSGFTLFQIAALLCVWGYWRRRRKQQQVLAEWELQEAVDELFPE